MFSGLTTTPKKINMDAYKIFVPFVQWQQYLFLRLCGEFTYVKVVLKNHTTLVSD